MGKLKVFAENAERYDQWFEKHYDIFLSELAAIEKVMPKHQCGVEIGVGSGRFAAPLGIRFGIDPVPEMLQKAAKRGIEVQEGFAEDLPYSSESFDYVLMTTTLCFLDDIDQAFAEVNRILQPNGYFTVAFIDKNSELGRKYLNRKDHTFYSNATLCEPEKVIAKLKNTGFYVLETHQTLLSVKECSFKCLLGHGDGAFVVINSKKSS